MPLMKKRYLKNLKVIQAKYPGIDLKNKLKAGKLLSLKNYKDGHEAHLAG